WSRLLQNAAHDSICGCSADSVSAQVLVRYAEAEQIADELTERALARIAAQAPTGSTVVVNPSTHARTEVVDLANGLEEVTVPPLGWKAVRPGGPPNDARVAASGTRLRNELLEFDVASLRIVDGGGFGDSYSYAPPRKDRLVEEPADEVLEITELSQLRASVLVRRTYAWPRRVEPDGSRRSEETISVPVELLAELRAGEPFVRLRIRLDNPCDDHRVRVHVTLPRSADH